MVTRRQVFKGLGAGLGLAVAGVGYTTYKRLYPDPAEIGFSLTDQEMKGARDLLAAHPSFDVHTHAGRTFVDGAKNLKPLLKLYAMVGTFEERVVADMKAGGQSAASFSAVSDFPILNVAEGGLTAVRKFENGEAWTYYQAQIKNLKKLTASGLVTPVLKPSDILTAHKSGKPGAMLASEGTDFLDRKLERVKHAYDDGLRMLTIMHYVNNELGDIITGKPLHNKLTAFGHQVVGEMNRLGMMIDISHSSEKTAADIIAKSTKPVLATHVHISGLGLDHPRFISQELAKQVVKTGGVIGAWPAGIGLTNLAQFVERIEQLVKFLGIDHVVIGSDMDANYKPVYDNFRNFPMMVGLLQRRGMKEADIAKLIGGNFIRVFKENVV